MIYIINSKDVLEEFRDVLQEDNNYDTALLQEEFIYELLVGKKQDVLERAIRGKGAFRRFKDRLYDLGLEKSWYKFRDDSYEKVARDWCVRFGIEIEE